MLGTSLLSPRQIRRLALVVFAISMILLAGTLVFGTEIKGARRWIVLLGVNIQPSELVKPAFVILIAWLFGESAREAGNARQHDYIRFICFRRLAADAAARFRSDHADHDGVGRAVLHGRDAGDLGGGTCRLCARGSWGRLLHGAARRPNRMQRFMDPSSGDTFQIDNAVESFVAAAGSGRGRARAR